jgi:hypothetical protein
MSDPAYVIQLGSGLYLDSDGVLHQGALPPAAAYGAPGGMFSMDPAKLGKTFQDIGDALPSKSDGEKFKKFQAKLQGFGAPDELIDLLGKVGEIAGAIGSAFVVLGVVVAAAKLLGLFGDGPSPLEQLVKARFDALEREIRSLAELIIQKDLRTEQNELVAAVGAVKDFVAQRDSGTMTDAEIAGDLQALSANLATDSLPHVLNLLDVATYEALFDPGEFQKVWPWIAGPGHLYFLPARKPPQLTNPEPVPATFPAVNTLAFDHRLAVPLASHAAQAFLSMLHSIAPEYRTTGDFRDRLRSCADKLTALTESIRNTALARTIYTKADFSGLISDFSVIDSPWMPAPVLRPEYTLTVGALDLRNHNDAFFHDLPSSWPITAPPGPTFRRGNLDFLWRPPATLERSTTPSFEVHEDGTPVQLYSITNPQECADAANQQAEQDYADLLVSSGYLTFVQLAAQMRHAATQPIRSETVRGEVVLLRKPRPRADVTVHSGPILLTGDIASPASRAGQNVQAFALCTTQPTPRVRPLQYRVLLRTLSSIISPGHWIEPTYDSIQTANYMNDPLHPGFLRLALDTSFAAMLGEAELIVGSSPPEARHAEGTLELPAHTFDWWIPVKPPHRPGDVFTAEGNHRPFPHDNPPAGHPGGGGAPRALFPFRPSLGTTAADGSVVLGLGWEDGEQSWQGQRREPAAATVQLHYKLDWHGGNLRVVVENRPEDRNYVLFVVVEETFGSVEPDEQPPKVLHTAFALPIHGQLTYVPQAFFDQEAAARDKLGKIISDFAHEYAVSKQPGPGDPVLGAMRPGELTTEAGMARLLSLGRQFEPSLLEGIARRYHGQF